MMLRTTKLKPYPTLSLSLIHCWFLETFSKLLVTVLPPPFVERQKGGDDLWCFLDFENLCLKGLGRPWFLIYGFRLDGFCML